VHDLLKEDSGPNVMRREGPFPDLSPERCLAGTRQPGPAAD